MGKASAMILGVTHVVIIGPNGEKIIKINSLSRLLRNIDQGAVARELVSLVKSKEMAYREFLEEKAALATLCNSLYTRKGGGDELGAELLGILIEPYNVADVQLKRLNLAIE